MVTPSPDSEDDTLAAGRVRTLVETHGWTGTLAATITAWVARGLDEGIAPSGVDGWSRWATGHGDAIRNHAGPALSAGALVQAGGEVALCVSDLLGPARSNGARGILRAVTLELARGIDARLAAESAARADEAAKAEIAQAKFLSFMSHDLRTGLHGVLLAVEVVRRDLLDHERAHTELRGKFSEQMEDLELIRRSVLETVALMDRFIYAERFRRNLVRVRREKVDFHVFADELRRLFASKARDQQLVLEINVTTLPSDPSAIVLTDKTLLSLLTTGLLGRALDSASPAAKIVADIHVTSPENWRLEIQDAGTPISPRVQEILTGHSDRARALPPDDPALGVALAKLAADALTARLELTPSPNGTRVSITK